MNLKWTKLIFYKKRKKSSGKLEIFLRMCYQVENISKIINTPFVPLECSLHNIFFGTRPYYIMCSPSFFSENFVEIIIFTVSEKLIQLLEKIYEAKNLSKEVRENLMSYSLKFCIGQDLIFVERNTVSSTVLTYIMTVWLFLPSSENSGVGYHYVVVCNNKEMLQRHRNLIMWQFL